MTLEGNAFVRAASTATAIVGALAVALWLGGLVVLGAVTAPIVFAVAPMPQSADAMTMIFRRFDTIAMTCAVVSLTGEAFLAVVRRPFGRLDSARVAVTGLAAAIATYEGVNVAPRIASLHEAGAVRGLGVAGLELAKLHRVAETCGKAEVVLLAVLVALQVVTWAGVSRLVDTRGSSQVR